MALTLTSPAFTHNGKIPPKYTCDEDAKLSPPLIFSGIPEETKSLALIMDDPDVPEMRKKDLGVEAFDHWVLFNIPPETREIPEGHTAGIPGTNSRGGMDYTGPCPPPEFEPREHRYIFTLYALSAPLVLAAGAMKEDVLNALKPVLIEKAELIGRYARR
jgi:Raf kinase inhibitor-like YbhB/YbcL family protein